MISQTAEYALRAIFFLSENREAAHVAHEIAEATRVPVGYLSKVLQNLGRAGLVSSQRGPGGGFALTKSPTDISIFEIIQAVDPIRRIHRCPVEPTCDTALCPLHRRLDDALAMVEKIFKDSTVGELLAQPCRKSARCPFPFRQKSVSRASKEIEPHGAHRAKRGNE